MQKFFIRNLDCASCADKLEKKIRKLQGVREVKISFATGMLYIDCNNFDEVKKLIQNIEPNAYLEENLKTTFSLFTLHFFLLLTLSIIFIISIILNSYIQNDFILQFFHFLWLIIYFISGRNVFIGAYKSFKNKEFFDENLLMLGASIAAFMIGAWQEAVSIMLFFSAGEYLQEISIQKSKKSIREITNIAPSHAHLIQNGKIIDKDSQTLKIHDEIILYAGEMLPCDAILLESQASFNCAAINGESFPKQFSVGEEILSGSIPTKEAVRLRILRSFEKSYIAKITDLIANATIHKSHTESFITTFARYYTPIVFCIALCLAILPPLLWNESFNDWIYRALVVLMVSCPCALIISVPIGYFGGLAAASKNGVLIKGVNYLETLSQLSLIAFDKTGTLTKGNLEVIQITPSQTSNTQELLESVLCAQYLSNHPIAQSIKNTSLSKQEHYTINSYEEIAGMGIKVINQEDTIIAGNEKILEYFHISYEKQDLQGSVVYVAKNNQYLGFLLLADTLKDESKEVITSLKDLKIDSIILSGDGKNPCKDIAQKLQCSYYHSLLPQDKARIFTDLKNKATGKVAFVGDGINDAPTLALADVGIAMGNGSDISLQSADIIILNNSLKTLLQTLKIARKTKNIIYQNIFLALGIKGVFIILGFLGIANIWEAVFSDVGVTLLALANSMRTLRV